MRYANFSSVTAFAVTLGLTLFSLTTRGGAAEPTPAAPFSIVAGPVLQCPTETSMRVTWITARNATGSVQYGPVGGEMKTVTSSRHGLIDANRRVHSIVLEDLRPGTEYQYRIASREILSFAAYRVNFGESLTNEFNRFRTLDRQKNEFSFLVYNDIHDQVATIPELLSLAQSNSYDFVVLNGDIVSHTDDEKPVIAVLDQTAKSFASSVPMFWVRGNHETRGDFARQLPDYMGLPQGRYYYAFDHGPVHFIVLDAGEDKVDDSREYSGLVDFSRYRREQGEWLKAHVRTEAFRRAKYRVVICHMPFASRAAAERSRHSDQPNVFLGMADAYGQFGPTLEQAGIDLMLSGHLHAAAVVQPEPPRHSYPVVIGGGNKGPGRTLTRVNVTSEALEALVLRPDGSQAAACRVTPRKQPGR